MYVHNVFLNRDITKNMYMLHPPSLIFDFPFKYTSCPKLFMVSNKLLGLNYLSLALLHGWGFTCSKADDSLFTLHSTHYIIYLMIYIDDTIITNNNSMVCNNFIKLLHTRYALRDLGKLNYFLNIEVTYNSGHLHKDLSLHIVMLESMPTPTS